MSLLRWCQIVLLTLALSTAGSAAHAQAGALSETISLRQLLQRALSDPPRVLLALAALQRAEADQRQAQAAYFPVLTLQVTEGLAYDNRQQVSNDLVKLLKLLDPDGARDTPSRLDAVSLQTAGTANLDWSLVNIARRRAIEGASHSRQAQVHAVSGAQRTALAAACELYMRALASTQFVTDAELTFARRTEQHEGIAGLVKAGLRPPVDETRARIEAVAARYRLEVRKVEERAAFVALGVSVGRDPKHPLRPEPLQVSPFGVPAALNDALGLALTHRPELKSLQRTLGARQAELSAALMRRAPTLGISGSATASYIDLLRGDGYKGSQYSANAVAYLRFSGLDATVWRSADVARANMLQAQRALEAASLDVQAEVADAGFAVERAAAELERTSQVLSAAQAAREAQHGRYRTGVASLLELLDAEAVEQNARFDRIQAERDHQLASVRLLSATGTIFELAR